MSTVTNKVVVIVRIPVPKFAPKWLVKKKMKTTVDLYSSINGLEFKLFTFESDSGDFGGIYSWRDNASAKEWFNPEWFARVRRERGNEAHVRYFDAPLSIDNMQGGTPASMGGSRVATLVEIPIPQGVSRELVVEGFAGAEETYRNIGGLLRKHFILGSHETFGGVYLWDSKASAQSWFNDQWRKRVSDTYGSPPAIEWFEVPIVLPARN